jgi:hypothetical protein
MKKRDWCASPSPASSLAFLFCRTERKAVCTMISALVWRNFLWKFHSGFRICLTWKIRLCDHVPRCYWHPTYVLCLSLCAESCTQKTYKPTTDIVLLNTNSSIYNWMQDNQNHGNDRLLGFVKKTDVPCKVARHSYTCCLALAVSYSCRSGLMDMILKLLPKELAS